MSRGDLTPILRIDARSVRVALAARTRFLRDGETVEVDRSLVEEPDLGIIFKPSLLVPIIGIALLALIPVGYKRWHGKKPA